MKLKLKKGIFLKGFKFDIKLRINYLVVFGEIGFLWIRGIVRVVGLRGFKFIIIFLFVCVINLRFICVTLSWKFLVLE